MELQHLTNLVIDVASTGYVLNVSSELFPVQGLSNSFDVNPSNGVFSVQPQSVTSGETFSVTVSFQNGFTGSVVLALTGGATGATLSGTLTENAVNGFATFNSLSINFSSGNTYSLTATGLFIYLFFYI